LSIAREVILGHKNIKTTGGWGTPQGSLHRHTAPQTYPKPHSALSASGFQLKQLRARDLLLYQGQREPLSHCGNVCIFCTTLNIFLA